MRHFQLISLFFICPLLITPAKGGSVTAIGDTNLAQKKVISNDSAHIKAKPVLDAKVDYHARDSIRLDASTRKMYLYGNASVAYQDLSLKAAYIEISMDSNIATAFGVQDSGKTIGRPEFHQGSDIFFADHMRYNFKSKKGRLDGIFTKEGEGYIHGQVVKKDSSGVFYIKNGRYSTCSLEADPHFYIVASRLKVIPHDKIITGPADLVIEGVPTPLAIPFGFFPLETGRHSGILIPTYGESQQLGFFLQNGGYYFGLSDHVDMQLRGDIYSFGSWGAKDIINYSDRYHYNGALNLAYSDIKLPVAGSGEYAHERSFFITWRQTQDPKANPNSTFLANVNAGGSKYYSYNFTDPGQFLQNTFQSNVTYTHNFPQTPFHLSLDGQHTQNTITHTVQISLPDVAFTTDHIYPAKLFESDPDLNSSKWYNSIFFSVSTVATNRINTYDSLLFKPKTLKQMQNGANTTIPISGSFHIFKYITFTPAFNFSSIAYFQTIRENWQLDKLHLQDTLVTDTVQGLRTVNTYNTSATFSTNIYGMYGIGRKGAVLIRQVIYPTVGFSFHPDYSDVRHKYYDSVQFVAGPPTKENKKLYSIFQNGIYGGPGLGESGAVNLGLGSNLEMKVRMHSDSGVTYKKIVLLERVNIGTSYNMAINSFNWADIVISGNTTLFKKVSVNFGGTVDPYHPENGIDTKVLEWTKGYIGRLTSADLSLSTTLAPAQKKQGKQDGGSNANAAVNAAPMSNLQLTAPDQYMYFDAMHPNYYVPISIAPWSLSLFYNILYTQPSELALAQNKVTQSVTVNGSAQVTKFWYVSVTTGYDLVSGQFTATSISAKRDMHCWEMAFTTIPFGFRQSFSVDVHVKASVLQDLKLSRRRDWEDTQQYQ